MERLARRGAHLTNHPSVIKLRGFLSGPAGRGLTLKRLFDALAIATVRTLEVLAVIFVSLMVLTFMGACVYLAVVFWTRLLT